jgi:hypothetical protein
MAAATCHICLKARRPAEPVHLRDSGDHGDNHVRFALIENEERTRQALRGIKAMLAKGVVPAVHA